MQGVLFLSDADCAVFCRRKILRPPGAVAGAPRPRQRPPAARAEALAPPEAPGRRDVRSSTKSKLEEAEAVRLRLSQEQVGCTGVALPVASGIAFCGDVSRTRDRVACACRSGRGSGSGPARRVLAP